MPDCLNVFHGEDALVDFYDPDKNPPVPLVELPERLNPYRKDGVRLYAKLMSALPASNVKSLPALNMLLRGKESGRITPETHTIVEYSSGSTVISLGILCHIMGIPRVKAFLSNKTPSSKLDLLRFFGLDLTLFGGHGQPEPNDPNGGIKVANEVGEQPGFYNPDQYSNPENYEAHERWTGPQIIRQLPEISVFGASVGTSGTMTGTGLYLKRVKPSVRRVGVVTLSSNNEDRVPGPRSLSLLSPVEFPWRDAVDSMEKIGSFESFEKSLELCRNGLLVGPSSGMALLGVLQYIKNVKAAGQLDSLRNEKGDIPCVFICCDQPFQYIKDYYAKLGPSYFIPITNEELLGVDVYGYNVDWEVDPRTALKMLTDDPKSTIILDLRNSDDYESSHIPSSIHLDVNARDSLNPYKDSKTMVEMFRFLDSRLSSSDPEFGRPLEGKIVIALSYKGHVGRLANSILRSRNIKAHCVIGGSDAWMETGLWDKAWSERTTKEGEGWCSIM